MKCFCLDIETTGTDDEKDVVLEVAGAVADLSLSPYSDLTNEFRILVMPERALTVELRVLAMHADLWRELDSYEEAMEKKEVLKVADDFYVVKSAKLMAIFSLFANAIKKNHFPLQKRMTVAGKNSDFDLKFLKRINSEFGQFFYSRKLDPGGLWVMESDDKPPDTKTCAERMQMMFPGMPVMTQHKAMEDNRLVAWLMRGGFRRLGMFGGPQWVESDSLEERKP